MALTLGDNFSYGGAKPLDARLKYSTTTEMKAVADATMYDGCLAYCTGTDKTYQWKSTNPVDETLGRWREFTSGGSSYTAGDGIDITNDVISTKQSESGDMDEIVDVLPAGGTGVMLVNAFNRSDLYSTGEKMIGQWIDGKPLYQRTITGINTPSSKNTDVVIYTFDSDVDMVHSVEGYLIDTGVSSKAMIPINLAYIMEGTSNSNVFISVFVDDSSGRRKLKCRCCSWNDFPLVLTVKYTKTTDTAVSMGEANEYSTTEKIVGTFVDGSPVYQKTLVFNNVRVNDGATFVHGITNLDVVVSLHYAFKSYNTGTQDIRMAGTQTCTHPLYNGTNYKGLTTFNCDDTNIIVHAYDSDWGANVNRTWYFTIQYTKTT